MPKGLKKEKKSKNLTAIEKSMFQEMIKSFTTFLTAVRLYGELEGSSKHLVNDVRVFLG